MTKENAGKDLIWQSTYGAYLCKLKKVNYGEFFTNLEADNQASLVVPITDDITAEENPTSITTSTTITEPANTVESTVSQVEEESKEPATTSTLPDNIPA